MDDLTCDETLAEPVDEDMEAAKAALLASPLVHDVQPIKGSRGGWYSTLWCRSEHPNRNGEQVQFSMSRTTDAACLTALLELVNKKHWNHLTAAEAARAAAGISGAAETEAGPSNQTHCR